jgi:antitoxin component of MazEF toxin-antitoxin module
MTETRRQILDAMCREGGHVIRDEPIKARLSAGETIITATDARRVGYDFLRRMNEIADTLEHSDTAGREIAGEELADIKRRLGLD